MPVNRLRQWLTQPNAEMQVAVLHCKNAGVSILGPASVFMVPADDFGRMANAMQRPSDSGLETVSDR